MKKIVIKGQEFYYDIYLMNGCHTTRFYLYIGDITRKKYYLFGESIQIPKYQNVFDIPNFNIESAYISKEEARRRIEQHSDLILRSQEIFNGILI